MNKSINSRIHSFNLYNFMLIGILFALSAGITAGFLLSGMTAKAEEEIPIYTMDDLLKISDHPSENYILMNDLDAKDIVWTPVDYTGTFNGNGHAILNLTVRETSGELRTTYDGNYKTYDTCFAGLFGCLENATVKDLSLIGIHEDVTRSDSCFIGSIAGYAYNSTVTDCHVKGTLRLNANAPMFGVGGIVGYGLSGSILNSTADVTLICIDEDKENRDEQFMGGGYSAGYTDVDNCLIRIDGYDSDHGYVHNGGLVGMYILAPLGTSYAGYITNTRVEGMITFFEDNTDRRAYCKDFVGEVMNWTYENSGNSSDFIRNEIWEYDKDLLPHDCEGNSYNTLTLPGSCEDFGYTLHTCRICGTYSYESDYTLKEHELSDPEEIIEATVKEEGLAKAVCGKCGETVYVITPVKEEVPVEPPFVPVVLETPDTPDPDNNITPEDVPSFDSNGLRRKLAGTGIIAASLGALIIIGFFLFRRKKK